MKTIHKARQLWNVSVMLRDQHMYPGEPFRDPSLTGAKLGLAALMFFYACLACLLPLLFINCMRNRVRRREFDSSETSSSIEDTNAMITQQTGNCWTGFRARCLNWTPSLRDTFIGRCNCLAAGALLSVGFLDVFMDTIESVETALEKLQVKSEFPIASFTTLLGFLLILGVEQITLEYYHQNHQHHPVAEQRDCSGVIIKRQDSHRTSIRLRAHSLTAVSEAVTIVPGTLDSSTDNPDVQTSSAPNPESSEPKEHSHFDASTVVQSGWIRVMILLFAISLHSIFEGMALGLCGSLTSLLTLFAALTQHKLLIAVSIGINLASETGTVGRSSGKKLLVYQTLAVLTFAGASPLGTLIGWAVTSETESIGFLMSKAILQGLACGTFCYVVFCELLPKELHEEKGDKAGKFFFLVLGFALVAFVIAFHPAE